MPKTRKKLNDSLLLNNSKTRQLLLHFHIIKEAKFFQRITNLSLILIVFVSLIVVTINYRSDLLTQGQTLSSDNQVSTSLFLSGIISHWDPFVTESFELGYLWPQGDINFHSEVVKNGETNYVNVADIDSTIGNNSENSLRVYSLPEKGARSYAFIATEIPTNRYLKWEFVINFDALNDSIQPIEFEINIEEVSKSKSTDLVFAYVPIDNDIWQGSNGDQWTAYCPNSTWIELGHYKLETGKWYKITVIIDLSDVPTRDFVLSIDDNEIARIPRFNSGSLGNYADILTAGFSISSNENTSYCFHADDFSIFSFK
jgi:hypothetical protein